MTGVDYIILAVIAISALIGIVRGFIRETLSLISWIAAFWLAFVYAEPASTVLTAYLDKPTLRLIAAFAGIFVVTLLLLTLVSYFLHKLLVGRGVQGTDRILGGVFGTVRGVVIVAVLLILLKVMPVVDEQRMKQAVLVRQFQPLVAMLMDVLPADMRQIVRSQPATRTAANPVTPETAK